MLALSECDTREVGLTHNLGEDRVREDRRELFGIVRHRSIAREFVFIGSGRLVRGEISREERAGLACRRSRKRESGLQVPGSLLGWGGAVIGAGRVGCLLTTDKLRCFHW